MLARIDQQMYQNTHCLLCVWRKEQVCFSRGQPIRYIVLCMTTQSCRVQYLSILVDWGASCTMYLFSLLHLGVYCFWRIPVTKVFEDLSLWIVGIITD